jgi:hypothetical protein
MSNNQPAPGAPPPRGHTVSISRVAGAVIDFSCVYIYLLLAGIVSYLVSLRALDRLIKGRDHKPTPQTLVATNVLQFLIRQAPNL